jgi:hypothetical protein
MKRFSHINHFSDMKPDSNIRELGNQSLIHRETFTIQPSPQKNAYLPKRIPDGIIFAEIPLESAKAYPTRIFENLNINPRIAYADRNTHNEDIRLGVKLLPKGAKTANHPQIVFFVNGAYHTEQLGYFHSNPFSWTTWIEIHIDINGLDKLIDSLIEAKMKSDFSVLERE